MRCFILYGSYFSLRYPTVISETTRKFNGSEVTDFDLPIRVVKIEVIDNHLKIPQLK
jgi:hypothetical protein